MDNHFTANTQVNLC